MIESFRSKPLRLLFEKDDASKIKPDHIAIVRRILTRLDAAAEIRDMDAPGLSLHPLKGERKGEWAVTVKKNWRVTFKIENGNVFDVGYEDYH
jgi:proteic killer suppression protein